ncbi:MAG TPA: methyltransferase domain-containing protein [Terracidiphilus sp.]|nr:methyltransferase domain-containing protein [Terracidiphilus sp.]
MGFRTATIVDGRVLPLLCDPDTRYPLEMVDGRLRNTLLGRVYPVQDGIPLFVSSMRSGQFLRQILFDRIAPGYDLAHQLFRWVTGRRDHRPEFLSEMDLPPQARVLEVSVGTGMNLRYMPEDVEFFGVDLSWGMLRVCRRNLKRWGRRAHLFQGEAERLPFVGNVFDCVLLVGCINSFSKKARVIREMLWVAKPGAKIVIVDEVTRAAYEGSGSGATTLNMETEAELTGCPVDKVPPQVEDLRVRRISGGRLYCLTFRKPRSGEQIIAPAPGTDWP